MTELICYTYDGWAPRLRPASPERDWMDQTADRFAYRCLPLAIANAHGWEMLAPCGFQAVWTGGEGPDAVRIQPDPGTDPRRAPVSMFGQATLTFHIEGLFRTSPGWNLWVGGPPNMVKDGIAPLSGIIETDWSPYSFTMNWRFTRPGQPVRFEEDEPFCFFLPVQRGGLEAIEPQLRPISDAPELKAEFEAWSRQREELRQALLRDPMTPTDSWQKLYYRGLRPDGSEGAADHAAKLRLKPFRRS